jgi:hypothetical protein
MARIATTLQREEKKEERNKGEGGRKERKGVSYEKKQKTKRKGSEKEETYVMALIARKIQKESKTKITNIKFFGPVPRGKRTVIPVVMKTRKSEREEEEKKGSQTERRKEKVQKNKNRRANTNQVSISYLPKEMV